MKQENPIRSERIGLYGGTFDPIHHGHLILARDVQEELNLDRVIFIPAAQSPHKTDRMASPANIRLAMIQAAIAGESAFEVNDLELQRKGISFAIDTVREILLKYTDSQLFFLIGQDNLSSLHTWKEIDTLKKLVSFVVLARGRVQTADSGVIPSRMVDISSSEIRRRTFNHQSIQYLVPDKVRAIIEQQNLYKELKPSTPKS